MLPDRREVLLGPLLGWALLFVLGAASFGYALLPAAPGKPAVALLIVAAQASIVLGGLMRLGRSSALVRMAPFVAIVWLGFLFLMSFADLWTR